MRPTNFFFEMQVKGEAPNHTPVTLVSGVLHCIDDGAGGFLPLGYYHEPTVTSTCVNTLTSVRQHAFSYSVESGLGTFDVTTERFRVTNSVDNVLAVVTSPPVAYNGLDLTFKLLHLHDVQSLEAFPSYNEVDSDVVLTTASPTAWSRPQPSESELVIKSNVLALIYAALLASTRRSVAPSSPFANYILLSNTQDMEQDAACASTAVLAFNDPPYDAPSGRFSMSTHVPDVTCAIVDEMLDGIAPGLMQRNDTLDITVSGIDAVSDELYTTSIRYKGGGEDGGGPYGGSLLAGLLEANPLAYANKQAICIAVSKYNLGRGVDTVAAPPFQFRYKKSATIKVLDEVVLDFERYYYIVYHFASEVPVRPLPLFSRPSANAEALRDVMVLSDKYDAHVDLAFTVSDPQYAFLASPPPNERGWDASGVVYSLTVQYAEAGDPHAGERSMRPACAPGRGRYQFFESESDLNSFRPPGSERVGPKLRLYFDSFGPDPKNKVPTTATTVRIRGLFRHPTTRSILAWTVFIPTPNIRRYTDARNLDLIELRYQPTLSSSTPVAIMDVVRGAAGATSFNDDISQWDIHSGLDASGGAAAAVSLAGLLRDLPAFNQPIGCWNTTGVERMDGLLEGATAFNQPIGAWDTSRVTTLACTFKGATRFNQDIGAWDVGRVSDFTETFAHAVSFNRPLAGWSQATTTDASGGRVVVVADRMFEGASAFNHPFRPAGFQVDRCMAMFKGAWAFNQPWRHLLSEACPDLTELFHGARSLAGASAAHDLPAACEKTTSMFEGATSWNAGLVSLRSPALADMTAMYKGATAFNQPVTVSTAAPTLYCTRMFQSARRMDSAVTFAPDSSGGLVEFQETFLDATSFNADVLFRRRITRASRMFKGALSYGDDTTRPKPSFGVAGRFYVEFGPTLATRSFGAMDATAFSADAVAAEMFAGSRFNDRVVGRAPPSCEGMFAGTAYFDTPLDDAGSAVFDLRGVTSMKRMFQGATGLTTSPIVANPGVLATVVTMESMFEDASNFNGDVTGWYESVATVTSFRAMFRNAVSFRPNISFGERQWQIAYDADVEQMFANVRSYRFGPVNLFPRAVATTRSVALATVGSTLTLTSTFEADLPVGTTASCYIVPKDQSGVVCAADVSGNTVSYRLVVRYDAEHSGVVTVLFRGASRSYAWSTGVLTTAHIYTFPSTFAYSTNSFGTGLSVRQGVLSALTLTFSGGDVLHSSFVAAQVEYVKYVQGSTVLDASVSSCSDSLETVVVALTPQATTDLTLRVKLRGPDGTLSGEITGVVPSAEIAPDWLPTAVTSVGSDVPAPHKLFVGSVARLAFTFASNGDLSSAALSEFTMYVDGTHVSLAGAAAATVSGRTLSVSYTAGSIVSRTFEFRARGMSSSAVVGASEVYAFPSVVSTAKGTPVVTLGSAVNLTTTFGADLPVGTTASCYIVPKDQSGVVCAADVSGNTVSYRLVVRYDAEHSGVVTVLFRGASRSYAWSTGVLTTAHIYTFPSTFAYSTNSFGTGLSVRQGVLSALTLTFSGGDVLHSSFVAAQVEYVKYVQGSTVLDASVSSCSDSLETVVVALTPQATTDLTLRVKLRGPDGTLSGEITGVVPSAEIAPDWLPTAVTSVGSDVPAPHKLFVGSVARLAFTFASNGDLSSAALSEFTMYVDGTHVSLAGAAAATVSGRTLSVSYTAGSIVSRTFEFRARGMSSSAVVGASEVYAFPSVVSTAKGTPVVTLGSAVNLTTTFGAGLPALITASMRITPVGYAASTLAATPSASAVTLSYTVAYDVAHSAVVSLVYGPATQEYAWSTSALTAAEIYTFPSAILVSSGWLHQLKPRALILAVTGGDLLHSSVVTTQIAYVRYTQGSTDTTVSSSTISCSSSEGTVTLGSVAPALLADVVLRVALRAPDGTVGPELSRTVPASSIAPQWVPTAAGSITSNVSSAHKLVVGSEVQLTFSFVSSADFPSTDASTLFSFRVDGIATSLSGGVANTTARTVRVAYAAASVASVTFEFTTAYGSSQMFTVSSADVYAFPTMSATTRGVSVVTLGQSLALTSSFSASLPSGTTAAVSIVPVGYPAVTPAASVSGSSVTYSVSVAYDVVHTGTVTLSYGSAQRAYSWAAGTLTEAHIYTFPSAFTYSGAANGYGAGYHLKMATTNTLTLTFTGGDLLHSSVVATQLEYVKFAQSGTDTTIATALLACSDPLETVTISSITPTSTASLTLKVKLRGPDGALSSEITAIIPSTQMNPYSVFWPAGVTFTSLSAFSNLLWTSNSAPMPLGIVDYWANYVDLSMYQWSDGSPVTSSTLVAKFGILGPWFNPAYYATTMPFLVNHVMMPESYRARYYFETKRDFKWGYSVPTFASRIALCLDNDLQGNGDQTPSNPTPIFDFHAANGTTWSLWGYPNKNYNVADRTLIGTFTTAHCTRSRGSYKWNPLSWPSGATFTHYLWQPSTYSGPDSWRSCPPILGM
jgi:hypothetical protein